MATITNFPSLNVLFLPFLELSLAQTNSQGAYLYRAEADTLQLVAWSGPAPSDEDPRAVLPNERLERFPEFVRNRFETASVTPLTNGGDVLGRLHVCRLAPAAFGEREAAFLRDLGLALGSLLAHATFRIKLESAVEELTRKLADRKLVERAKGILQASMEWTEEEAYLFLRRTSRQKRTPMREIARLVVDESLRSAQ
jgi:hypothetical protein